MRNEKLQACLTAMVLSFCIAFGGVACMVTGLSLQAELGGLALCCSVATCLLCLLVALPKGGWGILALIAGSVLLGWMSEGYREEWRAMVQAVCKFYEMAYSFTPPAFLEGPPTDSHLLALLTLHGLISMVVSWIVLRRYPAAMAVFLSLVPMVACFVVTDTVPQLWCILLYLFGLVLLLITHPVRIRDMDQGLRLTQLLALPVAAALALLCLAVPQEGYEPPEDPISSFDDLWDLLGEWIPFFGTTSDGELVISFGNTLPDRVDLEDLGQRIQRPTPVMELETTFSGMVYLRGRDHDLYDGLSWTATPDRTEQNFALPEGWRYTRGFMKITQLSKRDHLYVPYYPRVSPVISGGRVENTDSTTEQAFDCITLIGNWEALWRKDPTGGADLQDQQRYLELPEGTLTQAQQILSDLYARMVEGSTDVLSTAKAIRKYVQSCAQYDLDPDRMPSNRDDLAIWFLQEADRGYCVHYATAAAVLLRAAGIPARYVEGYLVPAQADQITLVRDNMAHAWVEYYVSGLGWMILDATPGSGEEDPTETTEATQPTEPEVTTPTEQETTAPTEASAPTRPTEDPGVATEPSGSGGSPRQPLPKWIRSLLTQIATLGLLIGCVVLQWHLRRRYLLRRLYHGKVNAQGLARCREAKRLSRLTGIPLPDEVDTLAERACFSQHKLTPQELSMLETLLRESVQTLQEKGWLHQLYYRFIWAAY